MSDDRKDSKPEPGSDAAHEEREASICSDALDDFFARLEQPGTALRGGKLTGEQAKALLGSESKLFEALERAAKRPNVFHLQAALESMTNRASLVDAKGNRVRVSAEIARAMIALLRTPELTPEERAGLRKQIALLTSAVESSEPKTKASAVSLRDLERKGFRQVKVLRAADINQLIVKAVQNVVAKSGTAVSEEERQRVVSEAEAEFERLVAERRELQQAHADQELKLQEIRSLEELATRKLAELEATAAAKLKEIRAERRELAEERAQLAEERTRAVAPLLTPGYLMMGALHGELRPESGAALEDSLAGADSLARQEWDWLREVDEALAGLQLGDPPAETWTRLAEFVRGLPDSDPNTP